MSTSILDEPRALSAPGPGARPETPVFDNRRFVARAGWALILANLRYWTTVAPIVRAELSRWQQHAGAIVDPELRALALAKLQDESFHAQAAAMLATLAPRAHRNDVVRAIVALEVLFDYLDGLTELPSSDPLGEGERLFKAFSEAIVVPGSVAGKKLELPPRGDDGYLELLSRTVSCALARLPAAPTISEVAQRIAALGGQAQTRMHAASQLGTAQVEAWAREQSDGTGLQWRELLAGAASSVLVLHALIAAAADSRTTGEEAEEIASAYLSVCVPLTLLDGLVDHDQDMRTGGDTNGAGGLGYLGFYADPDELSQALSSAARRAAGSVPALRHGPHHAITLVGVVAYYTSAPGARGEFAAPIVRRLQRELAPLIYPTLALMRTWRLAKRIRNRRTDRPGGLT